MDTQTDAVVSEESNDDDGEGLQESTIFPGLSDPTPSNVSNTKESSGVGEKGDARSNGKRKLSAAEEKEEPGNQELLSLAKDHHAVSHQNEPEDDEVNEGKDGEEGDGDVVPQLRRRFCMMRASTRGELLVSLSCLASRHLVVYL